MLYLDAIINKHTAVNNHFRLPKDKTGYDGGPDTLSVHFRLVSLLNIL
eukprot:SAG31_NODE_4270_length_3391_cov_15.754253_3_plen_48_part_00